jgi:hypothetical protein
MRGFKANGCIGLVLGKIALVIIAEGSTVYITAEKTWWAAPHLPSVEVDHTHLSFRSR